MNLLEKRLEIITNCQSIAALESQKVCTEIANANEYGLDVDTLDQEQFDALQTARKETANALSTLDQVLKGETEPEAQADKISEARGRLGDLSRVVEKMGDGEDLEIITERIDEIYEILNPSTSQT